MKNAPRMAFWNYTLSLSASLLAGGLYLGGDVLQAQSASQGNVQLRAEIYAVSELEGEPSTVSAGGLTPGNRELATLENDTAFHAGASGRGVRRLVIIGGLSGQVESAYLALDAVRWFKEDASATDRSTWAVSALPLANPAAVGDLAGQTFPPSDGYFNAAEQPESRYLWRWVTYQAPDLVVVVEAGADWSVVDSESNFLRALEGPRNEEQLAGVQTLHVQAPRGDAGRIVRTAMASALEGESELRQRIQTRIQRNELAIAELLAGRYPENPGMSYIPAVAWTHTLRLGELIGDDRLRSKVLDDVRPWLEGDEDVIGERVSFAGLAGAMVFGELARTNSPVRERSADLVAQSIAVGSEENAPGVPTHGSGWSDDVFLGTISAVTAGDREGLEMAVRMVRHYAATLQQEDGLFYHAADAPTRWGRGNGFAALGLAEVMTAVGPTHSSWTELIGIYRQQMNGLRALQAPDGMWNQVVDLPGSYRETSVTAMVVTAMARGLRLGWLGEDYSAVVERGWRALKTRILEDGTLVDVCISTGSGTELRHYLDRTAVNGADDRGGALTLGAALEMYALKG